MTVFTVILNYFILSLRRHNGRGTSVLAYTALYVLGAGVKLNFLLSKIEFWTKKLNFVFLVETSTICTATVV